MKAGELLLKVMTAPDPFCTAERYSEEILSSLVAASDEQERADLHYLYGYVRGVVALLRATLTDEELRARMTSLQRREERKRRRAHLLRLIEGFACIRTHEGS